MIRGIPNFVNKAKIKLEIDPTGCAVEVSHDGVAVSKTVSIDALRRIFSATKIETPLLPADCLKFIRGSRYDHIVLARAPKVRTIEWGERRDGNNKRIELPFPCTIAIVTLHQSNTAMSARNLFFDMRVFAARTIPILGDEPLYVFPYGNVNHSGGVCWGRNALPDIRAIRTAGTAFEMFLNAPFNMHMYGNAASNAKEATGKQEFPTRLYDATGDSLTKTIGIYCKD